MTHHYFDLFKNPSDSHIENLFSCGVHTQICYKNYILKEEKDKTHVNN